MHQIHFIMKNILSFLLLWVVVDVFAQAPMTVSTFHNLSVYWSPVAGEASKKVLLAYRAVGAQEWKDALPMEYHPIDAGINPSTQERYDKADYRGSIVNLTPGQTYEIQLTLEGTSTTETIQATTWSEDFPISQTITFSNQNTSYHVEGLIGSPSGYILLDGTNSTIDISDNSEYCIFLENCEYVIVRGFTLKNGGLYGIQLAKAVHVIIEDCDISGWGQEDIAGSGFGVNWEAAIYAPDHDAAHCVIQRNKIHHPRWDTNSWNELHDPNADPNVFENYHPEGPHAVTLGYCDIGNNVIRYNEFYSDESHYFNDIVGAGPNAGFNGSPGPDSDIYGNFFSHGHDDGIEAEGGSVNVRIWNNYIERVLIAIGNAPVTIGPLYVWKNISGIGYEYDGAYNDYGGFVKMGFADGLEHMQGQMYIFNNTILQPSGDGLGGLGTSGSENRHIRHCMSRNNILHVRTDTDNSISTNTENFDVDYDFDLLSGGFPSSQEANGISGVPSYESLSFDYNTKVGDFRLSTSSEGYDGGVVIPNFMSVFNGAAPDMGAHESGTDSMVFGVNANFMTPLPVEYLNPLQGIAVSKGIQLTWRTATEINAEKFTIQKLSQNRQWEDVQDVSAGKKYYQVIDSQPVVGSNVYRLRQIDLDGQSTLSDAIDVEWKSRKTIQIVPNPTTGNIHFLGVNSCNIIVKNQIGQVVFKGSDLDDLTLAQKGLFIVFYYEDDGRSLGSEKLIVW